MLMLIRQTQACRELHYSASLSTIPMVMLDMMGSRDKARDNSPDLTVVRHFLHYVTLLRRVCESASFTRQCQLLFAVFCFLCPTAPPQCRPSDPRASCPTQTAARINHNIVSLRPSHSYTILCGKASSATAFIYESSDGLHFYVT